VVRVEEYGGFAGSSEPFAVSVRIGIARAQDLDILQTRPAHLFAGQRGRLLDLLLVLAVRADAGDGDQICQVADQGSVILREPIQDGLHDASPRSKAHPWPWVGLGSRCREPTKRVYARPEPRSNLPMVPKTGVFGSKGRLAAGASEDSRLGFTQVVAQLVACRKYSSEATRAAITASSVAPC